MNKYTVFSSESIMVMANLDYRRTGLSADIWSEHKGFERNVSHKGTPRVKIKSGSYMVSVTVEPEPKIKAESKHGSKSQKAAIKEAMKYIGRNYDLFLKHYYDEDGSFDDRELINQLEKRGDYR